MANEITKNYIAGAMELTHPSGVVVLETKSELENRLTLLQSDDTILHAEIAMVQADIVLIDAVV